MNHDRSSIPLEIEVASNGSSLNDQSQMKNFSWSSCDAATAAAAASSDTLLNHMKSTLFTSQKMAPAPSQQGSNAFNLQNSSGTPSLTNNLFLQSLPTQVNPQQMMLGSFPASLSMNLAGNVFDHPLIKGSAPTQPFQTQEAPKSSNNAIMQNMGRRNSLNMFSGGRRGSLNTLSLLDESLDALLKDESFGLDSDDCNPSALALPKGSFVSSMPKRTLPTGDIMFSSTKRQRTGFDSASRGPRFRPYQEKQWQEQFQELLKFKEKHGHCLVPHTFEENQTLSRWVKRQRYQYKLMKENKVTTMTNSRVIQLEEIGFVWDSHAAAWQERLGELEDYLKEHGDVHVPSNYPENPQLATWVKCQRRQGKLYFNGRPSNMTRERATALNQLGFSWGMRHGL